MRTSVSCGDRPRRPAARPRAEPASLRHCGGEPRRGHAAHSRLLDRNGTTDHFGEPGRERLARKLKSEPVLREPSCKLSPARMVSIQFNSCCIVESARSSSHAQPVHDLYTFAMTTRTPVGTLATSYRADGDRRRSRAVWGTSAAVSHGCRTVAGRACRTYQATGAPSLTWSVVPAAHPIPQRCASWPMR